MRNTVGRVACALAFAMLGSIATHVIAQTLPRQISLVVPFAAGGSTDGLARIAAQRISAQTGSNVIVDNRGGAGGYIGAEFVSRAPGDGSTLLITAFETLHTEIFTKELAITPSRALVPIAGLGFAPHTLLTPSTVPVKTLREFIAHVKGSPGKLNAGVVANTSQLLETMSLMKQLGLDMTIIPFNGGAAVVTSMLRGEVQFYMGSWSSSQAHVESGKLTALAISSSERFPLAPQVPTTREEGVNFEAGAYYGVLGPASMPANLVNHLNKVIVGSMNNATIKEAVNRIGYVQPPIASPGELATMFQRMNRNLKETASNAGLKPQ